LTQFSVLSFPHIHNRHVDVTSRYQSPYSQEGFSCLVVLPSISVAIPPAHAALTSACAWPKSTTPSLWGSTPPTCRATTTTKVSSLKTFEMSSGAGVPICRRPYASNSLSRQSPSAPRPNGEHLGEKPMKPWLCTPVTATCWS